MPGTAQDPLQAVCDEIVATYLQRQGHTTALNAFEASTGRPGLAASYKDVPRDLRTLVEQSASLAAAQAMARTQLDESDADDLAGLIEEEKKAKSVPYALEKTLSHLHLSNLLSIHAVELPEYLSGAWSNTACIATTSADKRIVFSDPVSGEVLSMLERPTSPTPNGAVGHDAAVLNLSQNPKQARYVASAGIDGRVVIWDLHTSLPVQTLHDHMRFAVSVVHSPCGTYLASAGYDRKIIVYKATYGGERVTYEKVHTATLAANPEALLFVSGPAAPPKDGAALGVPQRPWLVYTQRSSIVLHYMALPAPDLESATPDFQVVEYNTNPDPEDYYAGYSLLALSLHPSGQYVCAQTGDHSAAQASGAGPAAIGGHALGDQLSRLLILPLFSSFRRLTLWTEAPSSTFSNPRHAWLANGEAAWVTGEDGVLRLVGLSGDIKARVLCHGVHEELDMQSGAARDALAAAAWARGGNTVIKDVAVLADGRVASCGFDRTVRVVVNK